MVSTMNKDKEYWWPTSAPSITQTTQNFGAEWPSAMAFMIVSNDLYATWSKAYCAETPTAILDIISSQPTGEIAEMYRAYV